MRDRKFLLYTMALGILLACQTLAPSTPTRTVAISADTAEPLPATLTAPPTSLTITDTPVSGPPLANIRLKLEELGGVRCWDNFDLTCPVIMPGCVLTVLSGLFRHDWLGGIRHARGTAGRPCKSAFICGSMRFRDRDRHDGFDANG